MGPRELVGQKLHHARFVDPLLLARIPIAHRHRAVFFGLAVDGEAIRRAGIAYARVTLSDRLLRVVLRRPALA